MKLCVLTIGKLKSAGLEALCEAWIERSRRSGLPIEQETVQRRDAQWARARALGGPIVAVDERGDQIDSLELSRLVRGWRDEGARTVAFLVGDAHGHRDTDRASATRVLALSRLTLPHRLAHVLLIEQLYRTGTILTGHPYHHG